MATERIKITPDYIIAKNSAGTVTYSAGTPPTGGATTFPPYLRSSSTSSINTDYDIYYNQVAPLPYPQLNQYNGYIVPLNDVGGSIFSLTAAPVNSTTTAVSTTLVEPGTYIIVPTVWYIESPGTTSDINTSNYFGPASTDQFKYEVKLGGVVAYTFFVSRYRTDTKTLWVGPTDQVSSVDPDTGSFSVEGPYSIKINYGMTNPDSTSITNPASYISDTYSTKTLSITPAANGQTVPGGCTLGVMKILYYSRGYLGMRYTK
jgi:hypothetical protein